MTNPIKTPAEAHLLSGIRYLTSSKECEVLVKIAKMDYCDIGPIQDELFDFPKKRPAPKSIYLKNKYLYVFSEGAINYIAAYESASPQPTILKDCEVKTVTNYLTRISADNLSIVSLGPGTSDKEKEIINVAVKKYAKLHYYPIDVSVNFVQLSMLNIFGTFGKETQVEIFPIVADFWKLAKYVEDGKNDLFYENGPKLFLLFGNTFGNYNEKDLLDQIMPIMKKGDVLFIGVNTWSGVKDKEKEKVAEIYRTNSTSEITRWLLHPLSYVPFYAGFLNQAKYFRFNKEESFLYSNNSSHKEEIITVVNNTICYAPCLDLAEGIFVKYDGKNIDVPNRIRVASSTNYCLESLHQWLANYTYDDGKSKNTWENIEPAISGDSVTFCLTKQSTDYPKIER